MLLAVFKLSKATYVRTTAINTSVLVMGGERDLIVPAQVLDQTAAQYRHAEVVRVPKADHMIFSGDFLSTTMTYIDEWLTANELLPTRGTTCLAPRGTRSSRRLVTRKYL